MYMLLIAATAPPVSHCHEDRSAAVECMCYCSGFPVLSLWWVVPACSGAWMEVAGGTVAMVCSGVLCRWMEVWVLVLRLAVLALVGGAYARA